MKTSKWCKENIKSILKIWKTSIEKNVKEHDKEIDKFNKINSKWFK